MRQHKQTINNWDRREAMHFLHYLKRSKHLKRGELEHLLSQHELEELLSHKTPLSQKLYRLMREVRREYHRHIAHLRFWKHHNILITEVRPEHRIEDLLITTSQKNTQTTQ